MKTKKPIPAPKVALQIGASRETVTEARAAINDILGAPYVDNATKVEALKALHTICAVNNTTVTNCAFTTL